MQTFNISDDITVVCQYHNTRNGFKHTATLMRDGRDAGEVKCTYLNRTWEAYEFDSVLQKLADSKLVSADEGTLIREFVKNRGSDRGTDALKTTGAVMALGDLFGQSPAEKNDWKLRMLKAGVPDGALIMPDDWDTLPEDEKSRRLDAISAEFTK